MHWYCIEGKARERCVETRGDANQKITEQFDSVLLMKNWLKITFEVETEAVAWKYSRVIDFFMCS